MNLPAPYRVLGVPITTASEEQILEYLRFAFAEKKKFFITTPNPEILVAASKHSALKTALESSDIALPDGTGIVLFVNARGFPMKRIRGREFFLELVAHANAQKQKVFLLGATDSVIATSLEKMHEKFPDIEAKGSSGFLLDATAHPVDEANGQKEKETIDVINRFNPDFLFVAFGHPKQELWVHDHFPELSVGGVMCVGGTLDYFSGQKSLPPQWMAHIGIEWLWRLFHEPWRIKRILTAILVFPFLVLVQKER